MRRGLRYYRSLYNFVENWSGVGGPVRADQLQQKLTPAHFGCNWIDMRATIISSACAVLDFGSSFSLTWSSARLSRLIEWFGAAPPTRAPSLADINSLLGTFVPSNPMLRKMFPVALAFLSRKRQACAGFFVSQVNKTDNHILYIIIDLCKGMGKGSWLSRS